MEYLSCSAWSPRSGWLELWYLPVLGSFWNLHWSHSLPTAILSQGTQSVALHKCSLVFRQGLKETPCRFLETLLCEVPSSPVPCPKTAAGSGGEMLICFLHPDCCSWTPFSFAVGKAFQGENCSACEVHLLVSLPARIIVLYVCVQRQKIVVSHTFPTFISSLWQKGNSDTHYSNRNTKGLSLHHLYRSFVPSDGLWGSFWSGLCLAHQLHHETCATCIITPLMHTCIFRCSCSPHLWGFLHAVPFFCTTCITPSISWLLFVFLNQLK